MCSCFFAVHDSEFSPSPGSTSSSSASAALKPSKSSTSLAEDINAIKNALEGASVTAREKTLKILERLTARLALAETERDTAMSECKVYRLTRQVSNCILLTLTPGIPPPCLDAAPILPDLQLHNHIRVTKM